MEKEKISVPEKRARRRKVIQQLRLMDDVLMRLCFQDNKPAVQLILRIIMDRPNLEVQELETQREANSISGRSVRFDVWARDGDAVYNIEIERTDERASAKRARYHSAMLDSGLLKSGEEFTKLVETFVISSRRTTSSAKVFRSTVLTAIVNRHRSIWMTEPTYSM